MSELPLQPIRRLIEKGADDMRISRDSVEEARRISEEMITRTAKIARQIAEDAGRRTVMKRDFKRAWVDYFIGESKEK